MKSFRLSREALRDLDNIFYFVARRSNMDIADLLIDAITDRFPFLGQNPMAGRARDEIQTNLRSFPVGEYLIYYRKTKQYIEIARVLHGARDQKAQFPKKRSMN